MSRKNTKFKFGSITQTIPVNRSELYRKSMNEMYKKKALHETKKDYIVISGFYMYFLPYLLFFIWIAISLTAYTISNITISGIVVFEANPFSAIHLAGIYSGYLLFAGYLIVALCIYGLIKIKYEFFAVLVPIIFMFIAIIDLCWDIHVITNL